MPRVGLEPTTLAFERANTLHTLDSVATVIGRSISWQSKIKIVCVGERDVCVKFCNCYSK
jgi:hypothetical protein